MSTATVQTASSAHTRRKLHISGIKESLRDFPLISKNKMMVQKRLSPASENCSEHGSSDSISLEGEDSAVCSPYEHA
jgi:hypothetical protein